MFFFLLECKANAGHFLARRQKKWESWGQPWEIMVSSGWVDGLVSDFYKKKVREDQNHHNLLYIVMLIVSGCYNFFEDKFVRTYIHSKEF